MYEQETDGHDWSGTSTATLPDKEPGLLDQVIANTPAYSMGAEALQATIKAEIDIQIATAKSYPRSIKKFKNDALTLATMDQKTATDCYYKLPRGGKSLEGPSVRLAEIVASAWGNLRTVARIISIDRETLTAQASCHDLETNVATTTEVRRRITNKSGARFNDDMITVTSNAALSIAFRNAIFKVVPFSHVKAIYDRCKIVSIGDGKSIEAQRAEALAFWKTKNVSESQMLAAVECDAVANMTIDHLISLRGFYTAIKEGQAKLEDVFPPVAPKTGNAGDSLEKRLADKAAAERAKHELKTPETPKTETAQEPAPETDAKKPLTKAEESDLALQREAEKQAEPKGKKGKALFPEGQGPYGSGH